MPSSPLCLCSMHTRVQSCVRVPVCHVLRVPGSSTARWLAQLRRLRRARREESERESNWGERRVRSSSNHTLRVTAHHSSGCEQSGWLSADERTRSRCSNAPTSTHRMRSSVIDRMMPMKPQHRSVTTRCVASLPSQRAIASDACGVRDWRAGTGRGCRRSPPPADPLSRPLTQRRIHSISMSSHLPPARRSSGFQIDAWAERSCPLHHFSFSESSKSEKA
jgi:hypothetical protein